MDKYLSIFLYKTEVTDYLLQTKQRNIPIKATHLYNKTKWER